MHEHSTIKEKMVLFALLFFVLAFIATLAFFFKTSFLLVARFTTIGSSLVLYLERDTSLQENLSQLIYSLVVVKLLPFSNLWESIGKILFEWVLKWLHNLLGISSIQEVAGRFFFFFFLVFSLFFESIVTLCWLVIEFSISFSIVPNKNNAYIRTYKQYIYKHVDRNK